MAEIKPIREFPEDVQHTALSLFHMLANNQRGRPEALATSPGTNPGLFNASGLFTWMCEHVGDLTHRMSEDYCDRLAYGIEAVTEKVRKAMRYLTNNYGFMREVKDNLHGNFEYRQKNEPWDGFVEQWEVGADAYADAHAKLTVWNEAQWHAREAAVALGRRQVYSVEHHLQSLKMHLEQGRESWSDWASMITVEKGQMVPYRGKRLRESADYDLQAHYDHYNKLLFDGSLPTIPLEWKKLKNIGGKALVGIEVDPTLPRPNAFMVRQGLRDKYANYRVKPGSLKIEMSTLYKRSIQALDMILIHEMIHVYCYTNGMLGASHGPKFQAQLRRCSKIVGFEVPMKDEVDDLELAEPIAAKPYGVILIESPSRVMYCMFAEKVLRASLDVLKSRLEYRVRIQHQQVTFYVIADAMWTAEALKVTVQRSVGSVRFYLGDNPALIQDLKQNGEVIAQIRLAETAPGRVRPARATR